jgi:hypothetical protein
MKTTTFMEGVKFFKEDLTLDNTRASGSDKKLIVIKGEQHGNARFNRLNRDFLKAVAKEMSGRTGDKVAGRDLEAIDKKKKDPIFKLAGSEAQPNDKNAKVYNNLKAFMDAEVNNAADHYGNENSQFGMMG